VPFGTRRPVLSLSHLSALDLGYTYAMLLPCGVRGATHENGVRADSPNSESGRIWSSNVEFVAGARWRSW